MRALGLLLCALWATASGCGSCEGTPAVGTDANDVQTDAGHDGGPSVVTPDAGSPDAGEVDAGPPPELKILKLLPPRGSTAGGTSVLIQGSAFIRDFATRGTQAKLQTRLKVGSNPVLDLQIIDDETMEIRTPPGNVGLANVTLENPNGIEVCQGCFTYFEDVFLSSVAPTEGALTGGNEVTLKGGGFTSDMQVLFGNVSSPQVTRVSSTELKVVVPPSATAQTVDVVAYNKNGLGSQLRVYSYVPSTRVSSVAPLTGPLIGGTSVVLTGTGFSNATAVKFGSNDATQLTVQSDTQILAVTPASTLEKAVDITVVTPRESWTVKQGFTYVGSSGPLEVYGIYPHVVSAAGGDVVTLTGRSLDQSSLAVSVGTTPVALVSKTAHEVRFAVPARGSSARRLNVVVSDGSQTATLSSALVYRIGLTALTPQTASALGGDTLQMSGKQFPTDAEVFVGALAGTVVGTPTDTALTLTTPRGSGGAPMPVRMREASDVENEAVLPAAFTFQEPLSVGRVQPSRGAIAGGTLVTVVGAGFAEGMVVDFGSQRAKDIKIVDGHTLTCRAPKGEVGTVDVRVAKASETDVLSGGFSYFDPRSISGGLSGGPLVGTLNITVLDATPSLYGTPIPLANVMLGIDGFTPFQGLTDTRGQITFSDVSLVKAQTVTVFKEGFQSTTVTSVNAENLTVLIERTGGSGPPSPPPPGAPPSIISGRVTGFKNPRPLNANESLEARVFLAQSSFYAGPPFRPPQDRSFEKWVVKADGGEFLMYTNAGLHAAYAILGVKNAQTGTFSPYLMGIKRGITTSADSPATGQDIVLDMHLDMTVPVTIDSPIQVDMMGSKVPATNQLYAWLDLGAEGFIPNPMNWNAGTGSTTSVSGTGTSFSFGHFPRLEGSNFVFLNLAEGPQTYPQSYFYRRQPGDISLGLTVGPMLTTPRVITPTSFQGFSGTIRWAADPGPTPDIVQVQLLKRTLMGNVNLWTVVLPGSETQVVLPPAAVTQLQTAESGSTVFVVIITSRAPKFNYSQWTYDTLSGVSWSSYTLSLSDPLALP